VPQGIFISFLDKVSSYINKSIEYLIFGMGISMTFVVALQVFFRYLLNQSLFWTEELARYLLVWISFLGATVAYRRKVHPGIDVIFVKMPPLAKKGLALVVHAASMGFFVVMLVYGYEFAHFVRLQISPALGLPKWIILSIIPISGAVFLLHSLAFFLKTLKGERP